MKTAALDIETTKSSRVACMSVAFSDVTEPVRLYQRVGPNGIADWLTSERLCEIVDWLMLKTTVGGYKLTTWNGAGFDFKVIAEITGMYEECRQLVMNHVDMMYHLFCVKGHPVSLKAACIGSRTENKMEGMVGVEVPDLWENKENRGRIVEYCAQDTAVTLQLFRRSLQMGGLHWMSKSGKIRTLMLPDGWLTVEQAMALPEPDVSWMSDPWPRSKFTDWMLGV